MTKQQEEIRGTVKRLLQFMRDVPENAPIEDDVDWLLRCLSSQGAVIDKQQTFPTIQIHGVIIQPGELERLLPNFKAIEPLIRRK